MKKLRNKQDLIDMVIQQIRDDFQYGDHTAIEELLSFLPADNLINYLPEDKWEQFKSLENA